jgi:hypothetical protein
MAHQALGRSFEMHELLVAACVGAIFGLMGFFITQHITKAIEKVM